MTGLLRAVVTTLAMEERPPGEGAPWPPEADDAVVRAEPQIPIERYRALYDAVGHEHHWTSRILPDERLASEIHAPEIAVYTLTLRGETAGWFEIETHRHDRRARIVHFAMMPRFRGRHLAGPLLDRAIRLGFSDGIATLIIETNTLDHPAALQLYRAHGFREIARRDVLTPHISAYKSQTA